MTACPILPEQAPGQARSLALSAAAARRALDGLGALRWADGQPGFSTLKVAYAGRTGACGNGLCEARALVLPCPFVFTEVSTVVFTCTPLHTSANRTNESPRFAGRTNVLVSA